MPRFKVPLESLERLSREARVRTPALPGNNLSWTFLWLGLTAACSSILIALATVAFYRDSWSDSHVALLRATVNWTSIAGLALSFFGLAAPLLVLVFMTACGRDPHAVIADRRRSAAVEFAHFIADRLDRLSIDTAKRAASAEISRFDRQKFIYTLLGGAGAAVTAIAKIMAPEAAGWLDAAALVGAALASGTTLGLLATLGFMDRLNRILDALNEAETILEMREAQMKLASTDQLTRSRLMDLLDDGVRRILHRLSQYRA